MCTSWKGLRLRVGRSYRWRGSLGYTLTSSLQGSLLLPGGPGVGPGRLPRAHTVLAGERTTRGAATGHRRISSGAVRGVSREAAAAEPACWRACRCYAPTGGWKRRRRCARRCRTPGLNLSRAGRGAGPGAGRGGAGRPGQGGEKGAGRPKPSLLCTCPPLPRHPRTRRTGGGAACGLLEDKGHPRSPPNPTSPRWWLLVRGQAGWGSPQAQRKVAGCSL